MSLHEYSTKSVPAEMDRGVVQGMEMVRLGARSTARFEFALDGTRSYQFATMVFMRLCTGNRAYEVQTVFESKTMLLTSHEHKSVRIGTYPPEGHMVYHMHEPCDRVRALRMNFHSTLPEKHRDAPPPSDRSPERIRSHRSKRTVNLPWSRYPSSRPEPAICRPARKHDSLLRSCAKRVSTLRIVAFAHNLQMTPSVGSTGAVLSKDDEGSVKQLTVICT